MLDLNVLDQRITRALRRAAQWLAEEELIDQEGGRDHRPRPPELENYRTEPERNTGTRWGSQVC
jgi:hypothetical protein